MLQDFKQRIDKYMELHKRLEKLRRGGIGRSNQTAKGFDRGYAFMLMEITGDELHFQTITDDGRTVDSGNIHRRVATATRR